ncbi:anthocyanidin 5,3-O-glucosyltransferase [Amborella trichopoda]|nr:anthocyanidin 5,3-O-glucosyltransferase [Amborella trichopoda]|eukprot:XP_006843340.2 anthocyanidin 5,3-O-glucosyltransferase [Amborella trichopoda]
MMCETMVFFPSPGIGHLIPMVELGKLILRHHPSFSITILITTPPFETGATAPYMSRVASEIQAITFIELPPVELSVTQIDHSLTFMFEWLLLCKPAVAQALQSISEKTVIRAFVMDSFCSTALDVATDLGVPAYFFYASAAAFLTVFLYFPELNKQNPGKFRDLACDLVLPGLPPLPPSLIPEVMQDRNKKVYEWFLYHSAKVPQGKGILLNSFEELEPLGLKALQALMDHTHGGVPRPPVYWIGPLVGGEDRSGGDNDTLQWLDSQPAGSVVFLSFGSVGRFSEAQIREIAVGLENSGQRFLWVVRSPPREDNDRTKRLRPSEPDLEELLPQGFLQRTADKGLVMKSWASQAAVLSCAAVGGFVSHCGWNSVLESVCAGVPMAAWPIYAEQAMNAFLMVGEMGLAVAVERGDDGFVKAEEVARCVRELMESEVGKRIRERMAAVKDSAARALRVGGSSLKNLEAMVNAGKHLPSSLETEA